jgi:hypothetical protein
MKIKLEISSMLITLKAFLFAMLLALKSTAWRYNIRYLPRKRDEIIFKSLHTRYTFLSICGTFFESTWEDMASHITTFIAGVAEIDEKQRNPINTSVVFLGEEPSSGHFKIGHTFFEGPSKTSRLIRNCVQLEDCDYLPGPVVASKKFSVTRRLCC